MVTVLELLLLICLFAGGVIHLKCESQPASSMKCLMNLDQARQVLGSTIPPLNDSRMTDNYYNISRALYPSISLPALYVKVTVQFLHDYQNGTKRIDDKTEKFTWSKACSYVSVKHCGLYAMSVFSLGTILPQRRETELVFTVPPFCKNSPYAQDDEMKILTWRYIVSTIEDITVNPKISDPRINTVGCVVKGHQGDREQQIEYPKDAGGTKVWDFCWLIFAASFLTSIVVWWYLQSLITEIMREYRSNMDNPDHKKKRMLAGTLLKMTVPIFAISILTTVLSLSIKHQKVSYACWYVIAYSVFLFVSLVIIAVSMCVCVCCRKSNEYKKESNECKVGYFLLFPSLFMTVHHLLWVLCGVISEPYWATPIFLIECLFSFSIMYCIYLYEKDVVVEKKVQNNKCCVVVHLVLSVFAFTLILLVVVFVGHGHIVDVTTASVIEVIITITLIWLVKNSGLHLKSFEKKNKQTNSGDEATIPLQQIPTTRTSATT